MSITEIHKLTKDGLELYYDFIDDARKDEASGLPQSSLPADLLSNPLYCQPFSTDQIDTSKTFSNRYEMANYLFTTWKTFSHKHYREIGVWAWLSATYFDQLRSTKKKGVIKGRAVPSTQRHEHFIPDEYKPSGNRDLGYRHAIRYPFQLFEKGFQDEFLKFCLVRNSASEMGDPMESIGGNKKILQNPALMNLIIRLYYDPITQRAKPGVFDKVSKTDKGRKGQAGSRRLIPLIVPRVKKSFDIHDMTTPELIEACGKEVKTSKWVK